MKWSRLGLVYGPDGTRPWARHSALQPTPVLLTPEVIRVFAGFRNDDGISQIGWVDVSADDPRRVLGVSASPCLAAGEPGMFDENGVVPCAVVKRDRALWLYYAGYMLPRRVRFLVFSGLAVSEDGTTPFVRRQRTPVTDRTDDESLFRVIHSILPDQGRWRVWYGAGGHFVAGAAKTLPVYNVRYMESQDGEHFPERGRTVLDLIGNEHRLGRPYVIQRPAGGFLMFYGYGSAERPYQLGMAESNDGIAWQRVDEKLGLGLPQAGWDSEMMAYPAVMTTRAGTFMFYNGNDYGRNGFGLAALEQW